MANSENPILKNIESGQIIEIVKSPFTIGRGLDSDYVIESRVVSRNHCTLENTVEGWVVKDSSTNGTMVNDDLFNDKPSSILKNNDEICLGFHTYTYRFLIEAVKVPNSLVERIRAEEIPATASNALSPGSPNSFDENGVSDDVLNNLADGILNDVAEQQINNGSDEPSTTSDEQERVEQTSYNNANMILDSNPLDHAPLESSNITSTTALEEPISMLSNQEDSNISSEGSSSESRQNSEAVYQFSRIVDPVELMLLPTQSSTSTGDQSKSCTNIPDLPQVIKNNLSGNQVGDEHQTSKDESSSGTVEINLPNKATSDTSLIADKNMSVLNVASTTDQGTSDTQGTSSSSSTVIMTATVQETTNVEDCSSSGSTVIYSLPDDLSFDHPPVSSVNSPELMAELNKIPRTLQEGSSTATLTTAQVSSTCKEVSDETKNSDILSFDISSAYKNLLAEINKLPCTVEPGCSTATLTTAQVSSTCKKIGNNSKSSDKFHIADSVERFKTHFAQTLDEVVKNYTVDMDNIVSGLNANKSITSSANHVLGTTHLGVVQSNQQHTNDLSNFSNSSAQSTSAILQDNNIPSQSSSSSLSVTSPLNVNKRVKVMTTTPVVVTAHSSEASASSTAANQKLKVRTVPPKLYPVVRLAPTGINAVRTTGSAAHRVGIIRPCGTNLLYYQNQGTSGNLKPYTIIRPKQNQEVLVLRKTVPINNLSASSSVSRNCTVTTQSEVVDLTNTQDYLSNSIVNIPSSSVSSSIGHLLNSNAANCQVPSTVTSTSSVPSQAHTFGNSAGFSKGNKVKVLASPVASSPAGNNTSSGIEVAPAVKCHDFQKPSTSKESENVPQSKQQNQGLDQNQYEEMENELMCTICANLFIKTVTLGCSHSFCQYCIELWKKKKSDCPICRNRITSTIRTLVLDNIIEKMLENASLEDKNQRKEAVEERKKIEEAENAAKNKKTNKRRGNNVARRGRGNGRGNNNPPAVAPPPPPAPPLPAPPAVVDLMESSSTTDSDLEDTSNSDSEHYDYDNYYEDDWYNGRPGAYFGGYGRCYNCGDQGHWANGCPYR